MGYDSLPAKMAIGATGGTGAAIFCHPLDVIRVSMQVATVRQGTLGTAISIFKESGLKRGLYSGLSAAFLRQWTYGSARIGIYSYLLSSDASPSFQKKLAFGAISGGIGSFTGTPAELALVRMSADAKLPVAERRGAGVHRVLANVVREAGVLGMWNGALPTIARAMTLSSVSLAVTSETKNRLPHLVPVFAEQPTATFVTATVVGSFFGTVASQPFDVVKSRMQNMVVPLDGKAPYSGALDCAAKTFRQGPLNLFRGFVPSFLKLSPYTAISLTLAEKITLLLTGKGAF